MKQIQYFMTEDKTNRIVSYTLWLENDEETGKLTFSKRDTPDGVWEPPVTLKSAIDKAPLCVNEAHADLVLIPQGFTHKEVIE